MIDDKNGPRIHAYEEGVHYDGELVDVEGSTYQARCDTARAPTDETHWICVAAGGLDGRSLRIRSTYKAEEKYSQLDVVALNGGSFVARRSNPGACPGEGWQAIAFQGKKGPAGPKGDRGERGTTGASFTAWELDVANYRAIPFTSDGFVGPILDLRPFFEQYMYETWFCMKNPALIQRLARELRITARVVELKRMAGVDLSPVVQRLVRDIQVRARVLELKRLSSAQSRRVQ